MASSCSSAFGLYPIDDFTDPKYVPSIAFGHLLHGLIRNQPIHSDDPLFGLTRILVASTNGSFSKARRTASSQLIVVIFFRGTSSKPLITSRVPGIHQARTPAKTLVRQAGHFPVEGNCAVADCDNNRPGKFARRFFERFDIISDEALDATALQRRFFEQNLAYVIANFRVSHFFSGSDLQPVDDSFNTMSFCDAATRANFLAAMFSTSPVRIRSPFLSGNV